MSNKRNRYRILWVDEEPDRMDFIATGQRYDLDIQQFRSWDKAKVLLENRFDSIAAIVLDGRCVVNSGEEPNPDFLYQVVREMESIFAQHEEPIPWYVLSSGDAPEFEKTLQRIAMGQRELMEDDWGRMYHRKDSDLQSLCLAIRHAVTKRKDHKVRTLYNDVFRTMDAYFTPDVTQTMLDILKALHFPEENRNFDAVLYYTQLRRILEHLFRAMNRLGVLPDEVMGNSDKVNLANSSLYLAGREVNLGQGRIVRFGRTGQYVFPPVISQIVKSILVVANKNSHTVELDNQGRTVIQDYYNSLHSNNFLFGYTLHLCDVLIWFGRYAKKVSQPTHSNGHNRPRTTRNR